LLEFIVDQPQKASDLLRQGTERWRVSLFGDRLHVITDDDLEAGHDATVAKLLAAGIQIKSVSGRAVFARRRFYRGGGESPQVGEGCQ
jgi:hypothetical protein